MAKQKAPELPSSHRHTKSTATYGIIPSEINPEAGLATPIHWVNEKKCTLKWVGEAETQLTINPTTGAAIHNQERTQKSDLPSKEWRVWTLYLAYHLLRAASERWAPQTSSFESQRGLLHKIHKAIWKLRKSSQRAHACRFPIPGPFIEAANWKVPRLSLKEAYLLIL